MGFNRAQDLELVLLATILVASLDTSFTQECLPGNANTETGHALVGTEYATFVTKDYSECLTECTGNQSCQSLNFMLTTRICNLNSATKTTRPDLLVQRINSIYKTKTPNFFGNMLKQTTQSSTIQSTSTTPSTQVTGASHPKSCLAILNNGNSIGDGEYWIDPAHTGTPIKAYCDMTTDGGGWTIIKRTIFQTTSPPQNLRIQSYRIISEFNRNDRNIYPTSAAMLDIHQKMGFHQIHFYCQKKSVGRVVSIMTKNNTAGQQVVRYYTDDVFASTTSPEACGSFDRLPEDTSKLGQHCTQWKNGLNAWGKSSGGSRLLANTFYIKNLYYYGCSVNPPKVEYCTCDDNYHDPMSYSVQDHWQISVR